MGMNDAVNLSYKINAAVMKRIVYKLVFVLIAGVFIAGPVMGQDNSATKSSEKAQKEAVLTSAQKAEKEKEMAMQQAIQRKDEAEKQKQMEIQQKKEAERRAEQYAHEAEKSIQYRIERGNSIRLMDDSTGRHRVYVFADTLGDFQFDIPEIPEMLELSDIYENKNYFGNHYSVGSYFTGKAGSSWNYSRRLLEATFVNEYSMGADADAEEVSLSISGDCAEGEILIAIYTPDGNKLSEVSIDANGSMNWHKSFKTEDEEWEDGNWVFKINAKDATGNFDISMNAY
jgi:hypothetical protein